jgi:transient receptor potential cation channel subfamily C
MFPIFSLAYILAPNSSMGKFATKPFVKFICHSASYMFFLFLLALVSQRIEHIVIDIAGIYCTFTIIFTCGVICARTISQY